MISTTAKISLLLVASIFIAYILTVNRKQTTHSTPMLKDSAINQTVLEQPIPEQPISEQPMPSSAAVSTIDTLLDLDGDGIFEKLETYFSGGAHCCSTYTLFVKNDSDQFKPIFEFTSGGESLSIKKNRIELQPYELVGYFYSCYACYVDGLPYDDLGYPRIYLTYQNKKVSLSKPNQTVNLRLEKNMRFLSQRGVPDILDDRDDGTRKAFAGHIITYYYNNHKDMDKANQFFYKYYNHSDKNKVWEEIASIITDITKYPIAIGAVPGFED